MPPNSESAQCTGVLDETDAETHDGGLKTDITQLKHANKRKLKVVWRNIILFSYVHIAALYGGYLFLTSAKWYTNIFGK